ncbi:hypothetical protein NQ317_013550 [Molorchus minor]|uniref:Uncharacterized protein n=1 Tax=Molorchus minor TaxID=1323400 RepID=A0ABQ9JV89_9CUCU|nr:hypothetical protein NQ317_013550 [Molorchus minor]
MSCPGAFFTQDPHSIVFFTLTRTIRRLQTNKGMACLVRIFLRQSMKMLRLNYGINSRHSDANH